MNILKYLDEMRNIQEDFLDFIENVENTDENFNNLKAIFEDMKIQDNKHDLRLLLHFISSISDNYFRFPTFFDKIERMLGHFKDYIKNYYSNSEIFNIFNQNKRILLFLIKEEIMTVDEDFAKKIATCEFLEKNYVEYFAPEIKSFKNEKWFPTPKFTEDLPNDFNEMRYKGENESLICKLIREDLVEDFIVHMNKKCISPNATINPSIYETNPFLLEKQIQSEKGISLIEYAAFFGSIQIFTYLKNVKAELTQSLWLYAIHGKNAELIHILEELHIEPTIKLGKERGEEKSYKECLKESIKCHHNAIANYFINNYLQSEDENSTTTFTQSLEYYNFSFLQNDRINKRSFCHLCHFDYYSIVKDISTRRGFDINNMAIPKYIF